MRVGAARLALRAAARRSPLAPLRGYQLQYCQVSSSAMEDHAARAKELQGKQPPAGHKLIREGNGVIIFPEQNKVFYNNVQVLNRDLSISVISEFARTRAREKLDKQARKEATAAGITDFTPTERTDEEIEQHLRENAAESGIKIFEALAASGLRSIRYFQQIPGVKSILVNDMDAAAVESIKRNVEFNELPIDRVIPNAADATDVMYVL